MTLTASALAETQLLLDALRPDQDSEAWEQARSAASAAWDRLAVHAIVIGLGPMFHHRLSCWSLTPSPAAAAKLGATYKATAARSAWLYNQLGEVLTACAAVGLAPIVLKGMHLAAVYYNEPALRPMSDIDLLFAPAELAQAETLLDALGYTGKHTPADLGPGIVKHTSTFRRGDAIAATPNPYLSSAGDAMIEPHRSLEESWFDLTVDITPGMRERAANADLGGYTCRVLAPEDLLLHLCVHFCFHLLMGRSALVQLVDIQVVVGAAELDWEQFAVRASEREAGPYCLAALRLARDLVGAPIGADTIKAIESLVPSHLRNRIQGLGLAHILGRTQQPPLRTIPQRILRGFADRAETARWAGDWRGKLRVWRTALRVSSTDTGRMLLRRKLH